MQRRSAYFSLLIVAACGSAPAPDGVAVAPAGTAAPPPATSSAPSSSMPPPAPAQPSEGVVLFATGAPIAGLAYTSGTQTGTTDAKGTFRWDAGAPVTFRIGGATLGTTAGAPIVSPYAIAGSTKCDDTDDVAKLVATLEAWDADADASNGITIGSSPVPLVAADVALRTFVTAFDSEAWHPEAIDTFTGVSALVRGQGVATDGTSWFFSGTTGLDRTDMTFASTKQNALAIPLDLAIAGSDHIGDIDVWSGTIYAPIEDKGYKAPKVVLYDPSSLSSGTVYAIPVELQTGGVPWIAVDGPRGVAYLAEWDPTPGIHVFSLADMSYQRTIALSRTLHRIQGAKVYRGQLYAAMDDDAKSFVKIDLATGTVLDLFTLAETDVEQEGLAFLARPDGTLLHTLNVDAARTGSELRHHRITREPLRWKV
ncbi:MAG TPA: hypothetical protein VIF62_12975, partial [Labilithrix sp.]